MFEGAREPLSHNAHVAACIAAEVFNLLGSVWPRVCELARVGRRRAQYIG
jgi:hypothetical protein